MSSLDVLMLRKQGKWQEALELALYNINLKESEYSRMALFWLIYDICKEAEKYKGTDALIVKCIVYMRSLQRDMIDDEGVGQKCYQRMLQRYLPNEAIIDDAFYFSAKNPVRAFNCLEGFKIQPSKINKAFHDNYAWVICRYLQRQGLKVSSVRVRNLMNQYFQLQVTQPSKLHSMMLSVALDFVVYRPNEKFDFNKFFAMWGPQNLRWQDRYSFVVFGKMHSPIVPRLLKVLEMYTDAEGLASITNDLPRWWWTRM